MSRTLTARLAAAFAIGLAAALAPVAAARPPLDESWRQCADEDADTSLRGCNAVIQSGRERGADLATAYYNRGTAYYHRALSDRAIQKPDDRGVGRASPIDLAIGDFGEAIRLKPDHAAAFVNRGIAYYDKGQYDRAIQDYDQAIRLQPDLAEAFNNRSLAYYKKGQYERATQDFDQTIRLQKNYGNALINRALGPIEAPAHGGAPRPGAAAARDGRRPPSGFRSAGRPAPRPIREFPSIYARSRRTGRPRRAYSA